MRNKVISLFILFCATSHNVFCGSEIPSIQQIESIAVIDVDSGWRVSIIPLGSGSIGFGSNPMDVASFPEGTFSLQEIYSALVLKLKDIAEKGDISVIIRESGAISTIARHIDRSEVLTIFSKAQQQSKAIDNARFAKLIKDHPIESKMP